MSNRIIKVCPGIGDSIWLFQKLVNTGERFDFLLPDGRPQRGKQIFDLFPQVASSATYVPGLSYKTLAAGNIQNRKRRWNEIKDREFFLSCNKWLEDGNRLEGFLPDLPINYQLQYNTTIEDATTAQNLTPEGKRYIGVYGSSYSSQRSWGFWDETGWHELIKLFHAEDSELVFVIIGASFDQDLGSKLVDLIQGDDITFVNTIGQPLSVVIEILKRLSYFIGFPSGLSILNETLGKDTFMFYPPHLIKMMNTWACPERIRSGKYKGAQFCAPQKSFDWIKNDYKLFNRI